MKQIFQVVGNLTVDTDAKTFTLDGSLDGSAPPPVDPPPVVGDAIDLSQAIITTQSPDVRGWPIGAQLTAVGLSFTDVMSLEFSKRWGVGAWPIVMGPEGEIQYTLWFGAQIDGQWYLTGSILCISRGEFDNYVPTGPALQIGQLPRNWYYYVTGPLGGYQPQPGELVAWFLTAGVQRRNDIHTIAERTQVVLTPFSEGVHVV